MGGGWNSKRLCGFGRSIGSRAIWSLMRSSDYMSIYRNTIATNCGASFLHKPAVPI